MVLPQMTGSSRPGTAVAVFSVQKRKGERHRRPWIVRWRLEGRDHSRAFRTRAEADRYRTGLLRSHEHGEEFDPVTGEPSSWLPVEGELQMHTWASRWLEEQWQEWQPRTRDSAVEALARFVALAAPENAPPPPTSIRSHLSTWLRPGVPSEDVEASNWLDAWSMPLSQLDRPLLAEVDRRLALRDDGGLLAPSTAGRYRKVSRACLRRAVELGVIDADPWPPPPRGRAQRKSNRARKSVTIRSLPDRATMEKIIGAIASHQPASRTYQLMTSVAYYAGLRPSEIVMLRAGALTLPAAGWGRINVTEADISFDESGEPKTGPRSVPIPPNLVTALREWVDAHAMGDADLLFRTRNGRRPTASNWARALQRAAHQVGAPTMRVYDCRHAAATTWLRAGAPLGEVARRLGHSVETLVSTYVGALDGDEAITNDRIELALSA